MATSLHGLRDSARKINLNSSYSRKDSITIFKWWIMIFKCWDTPISNARNIIIFSLWFKGLRGEDGSMRQKSGSVSYVAGWG